VVIQAQWLVQHRLVIGPLKGFIEGGKELGSESAGADELFLYKHRNWAYA